MNVSKLKNYLLLAVFNGRQSDDYVTGFVESPIPFHPEENYKIPSSVFYQTASNFLFRKNMIGEAVSFTLKLHVKLIGKSIVDAIILIFGFMLLFSLIAKPWDFDNFVANLLTQQGFKSTYFFSFLVAYLMNLCWWVVRYPNDKSSFLYFCQRNWLNHVTGKNVSNMALGLAQKASN